MKFYPLVTVFIFLQLSCLAGKHTHSLPEFPSSLNVKDFGAVGDGVTDDTQALQAVADEIFRIELTQRFRAGHWRGMTQGTKATRSVEVYFPSGTYAISDVVVFQQSAILRGAEEAVILQKNPDKDIFYFHYSFRYFVDNLHFIGGQTQLKFWTGNVWSRVLVKNCRFEDSHSYAVECLSFTEKRLSGENWNRSRPWPPYLVEKVNGHYTAHKNHAEELQNWYNSTLLVLDSNHFQNCLKALSVACDTALIKNTSIVTPRNMEGAAFHLSGQTRIQGLKGIAHIDPERHQYWMEGDGNVSLRDIDLDTDSDQGICLFRSSILPRATTRGIRVENARVKVAGSQENAIVWIQADTLPSILSLDNVTETSGKIVQAIGWESVPDSDNLVALKQFPNLPLERQFMVTLSRLGENIHSSLPDTIQPLLQTPIPPEVLEAHSFPPPPDHIQFRSNEPHILHAEEFGILTNSPLDQTTTLQNLFDHAKTLIDPLIIFPGASTYIVSDTITLPSRVSVRVAGSAFFVQSNPDKDLFSVSDARFLSFTNCDFSGGRNGLQIETASDHQAYVEFEHCSFYDQTEAGIQLLSLTDSHEAPNQTQLLITNAIFRTTQALVTNASLSYLSGFWAFNDPHLNDRAFIENRGGHMVIESMLGNPVLWHGKRSKIPPDIVDWSFSRNVRWVDNWGILFCRDLRFGGESGGMCNIYNRSPEGIVYINGGLTRHANNASKMTILFAEEIPKTAILRDISAVPIHVDGVSMRIMGPDGSPLAEDKQAIYTSGVLTP